MRAERLHEFVEALNNPDEPNYLSKIWEVVALNALSKIGSLSHEPSYGGKKTLDALVSVDRFSGHFAIEITAVSDRGLHQRNPVDLFEEQLKRRIQRVRDRGIEGQFSVGIGEYPRDVIASPTTKHSYFVNTATTQLGIHFDPSRRGFSLSRPHYTSAFSIRQNPLFNALHDKAQQIRDSGFKGNVGILVCDADCESLVSNMTSWATFHRRDIIQRFLRKNKCIGFVGVVAIVFRNFNNGIGPSNLRLRYEVFPGANYESLPLCTRRAIGSLSGQFPVPMYSARNARHHLSWLRNTNRWGQWNSLCGGLTMSDQRVSISSRALLQFLAGEIDRDTFFKAHGFDRWNPFMRHLSQGELITSAAIQTSDVREDDDEWISFQFGEPDAAISPFRERPRPSSEGEPTNEHSER